MSLIPASIRPSSSVCLAASTFALLLSTLAVQAEDAGQVRGRFLQHAVELSATEDFSTMLDEAQSLAPTSLDRRTYEELGERLLAAARLARFTDEPDRATHHLRAAEHVFDVASRMEGVAGGKFFLHRAMVAIEELLITESDARWGDAVSWLKAHLKAYPEGADAGWARRILAQPYGYAHALAQLKSSQADLGPLYVGGDVQEPVKVFAPMPIYTKEAREARIQGVVILQVVIDQHGNVTQTKILKGLSLGLGEQAEDLVATWLFEPAKLNGKPVSVYYNLTVNFRLK